MKTDSTINWIDPVKNVHAKESTMQVTGDFAQFTTTMRRLLRVPPAAEKRKPKSASASRVPAVVSPENP